jgi:uncharacterized protein YecE (DUF72 family)
MLYCGTSGWNYNHWRRVFYPDGMPQSKWLEHYASHFDTVEVNNSFYRLPERKTFDGWKERTPEGFAFAVKASRYLTHIKRLSEPEEPLQRLLDHSSGLGSKLSIVLYQFPPNWQIDLDRLRHFLEMLPAHPRSTFEFRDDSWQCDAMWSMLEEFGVAYCVMDAPGLPLHLKTTCDYSYIRMHSGGIDTDSNYADEHLRVWAERVTKMLELGDVYIYFNNDYRGYAVRNALRLREMLG